MVSEIKLEVGLGDIMLCFDKLESFGNRYLIGFSAISRLKIWDLENLDNPKIVSDEFKIHFSPENIKKTGMVAGMKSAFKSLISKFSKSNSEENNLAEGNLQAAQEEIGNFEARNLNNFLFSFKKIYINEDIHRKNSVTIDIEKHRGVEEFELISFSFDFETQEIFNVEMKDLKMLAEDPKGKLTEFSSRQFFKRFSENPDDEKSSKKLSF